MSVLGHAREQDVEVGLLGRSSCAKYERHTIPDRNITCDEADMLIRDVMATIRWHVCERARVVPLDLFSPSKQIASGNLQVCIIQEQTAHRRRVAAIPCRIEVDAELVDRARIRHLLFLQSRFTKDAARFTGSVTTTK
jgi:hypothetical protein